MRQNRNWSCGWQEGLFFLLLIFSVLPMVCSRFWPTFDNPVHLYTAAVIKQLITGNKITSNYFSINPVPVPNWMGTFLLTTLSIVLPPWVADKAILIIYVLGLPLSFRYFVRSFGIVQGMPILIFPFIYSFIFFMGFYNLCISFSVFFWVLGYWERIRNVLNIGKATKLGALCLVLYFSHLLTFVFFIATVFLREFLSAIAENKTLPEIIKAFGRYLRWFLLSILPALGFSVIYFTSIHIKSQSGGDIKIMDKMSMLFNVAPLVIAQSPANKIMPYILMCVLALLLVNLVYRRIFNNDEIAMPAKSKIQRSDYLLAMSVISLGLFLGVPDNWNAGMMSSRLLLIFFLLFISWLSLQRYNKYVLFISLSCIAAMSGYIQTGFIPVTRRLSHEAEEVEAIGKIIEPGKCVVAWNRSEDWLEPHFSNFLAVNNPVVLLDNFEANTGWFPVVWKMHDLPDLKIKTDKPNPQYQFCWPSNPMNRVKYIDYIFIFKPREDVLNMEFKDAISRNYSLIFVSANCKLYKLI